MDSVHEGLLIMVYSTILDMAYLGILYDFCVYVYFFS